jgi:hypothetical protein
MVKFGRLEKGKRPADKPLQALRYPAQTRHDGKIFETYPHGKAFGTQRICAGPVGFNSRNIYCSILLNTAQY